ncbi:hypothetical protein ABZ027_39370 [Streptomyces sp. NPDC006332]|uniref:hypothetical protein n=1 Tax=Streptomyces sp. NPDC006332 TaxID=3155456 RepID=UPI0033A05B0A
MIASITFISLRVVNLAKHVEVPRDRRRPARGDGHVDTGQGAGRTVRLLQHGLSRDSDVWLASCRDFHASPFARRPGSGCPVAVWGCLECPNAVFTTRHLPAILSFAGFLTAQREAMTVLEWNARYALAWERITTGILPQFTCEQ